MATPASPQPPGTEGQLLAAGLYQLLSPVVEECDARIQEVMDSQAHLSTQIETLAADLDHFMTFTQTPPLAAHLQRLLNARNRLVTINTTLLTIMGRLDRISAGVDPQVKERKLSIGGLFSSKPKQTAPLLQPLASPQIHQSTQPPQTTQPTQPTHPQEQSPTSQESKDTTKYTENTEQQKESIASQEAEQK